MDSSQSRPEGVLSVLDTDLYKLTMQCAVLQFFPKTHVTYKFTNRTPDMRLSHEAFLWVQSQVEKLNDLFLSSEEHDWLKSKCPYLKPEYLGFLHQFRFKPSQHVKLQYVAVSETHGDISLLVEGLWVDTILYEIPLLALVSEAYFKFCDRDWSYEGQEKNAYGKGIKLLRGGCVFSEFGTRRRRDTETQHRVIQGLKRAAQECQGCSGKLTGTSNVYFAKQYDLQPVGTMAHEWFMGIAASENDYEDATRTGLRNWTKCFGKGVLAVALTDTFGTPAFLKIFGQLISEELINHDASNSDSDTQKAPTYAEIFTGVRQDSGDPLDYINTMRKFYETMNLPNGRTIVFSDSLNVEKCIEYKSKAEQGGFKPTFGIGTFLTNDFKSLSSGAKSVPLNIVIKLSSAEGRPAVKLSDDLGKNTGDQEEVEKAKKQLGYVDKHWEGGNEQSRWG
ncbi:nicotinate phosphoribosyltransferase [Xylographa vitiligo]|nr:nicotinate phosphoribosyltransferase [Xylographa vitiligo]